MKLKILYNFIFIVYISLVVIIFKYTADKIYDVLNAFYMPLYLIAGLIIIYLLIYIVMSRILWRIADNYITGDIDGKR